MLLSVTLAVDHTPFNPLTHTETTGFFREAQPTASLCGSAIASYMVPADHGSVITRLSPLT